MPGGYAGVLLRVDLTKGTFTREAVSPAVKRSYVGGTGLGAYILYNEVHAGVDPLSSGNRLMFSTGPFTGSGAPGSGNYSVVTRSPLSGFAVSAQSNGHFGAVLKRAGFDAIVFQGASNSPVYLHIKNGEAYLEDAGEVWGKDTFETEALLAEKHRREGSPRPRVACIGPAGENMVLFAAVENDLGHLAASGGVGAVMGSKKLKAVVVEGNGRVPVNPGSRDEFKSAIRQWAREAKDSGLGLTVDRLGSAGLFAAYYRNGWVPVKNLTETAFSEYEKFDGIYLRQNFPNFVGGNVTSPFKTEIINYLDEIDEKAKIIGAVNVITLKNGILKGFNTDGEGFVESLKYEKNIYPKGHKFIILGCGGAARAIIMTLAFHEADKIYIANRTFNKALDLAEEVNTKTIKKRMESLLRPGPAIIKTTENF